MKKLFSKFLGSKEIVCPYCKKILEKKPKKKTKCKFCGKFIFVRNISDDEVLVTEKEVQKIDKEKEEEWLVNDWINKLSSFGITRKDFERIKSEKLKKSKTVRGGDVLWYLFNAKAENLMKISDWQGLKMIYYNMALFLNQEGKGCFQLLEVSAKMELMNYRESGVKKVEICASQGCEECKKFNGKTFLIEEALEMKPIPCKKCTHKMYDEKFSFCRCMYLSKMD